MKTFRDKFGNRAIVETKSVRPYKGAYGRCLGYRLMCFAEYDDDFLYYVSVYGTETEAMDKLMELSGGTWEEVL